MVGVAGSNRLTDPEKQTRKQGSICFLISPICAFCLVGYAIHIRDGIRDLCNLPRCHVPFYAYVRCLDSDLHFSSIGWNRCGFYRVEPQPVLGLKQTATDNVGPGLPGNRHCPIGLHGFFPLDTELLSP